MTVPLTLEGLVHLFIQMDCYLREVHREVTCKEIEFQSYSPPSPVRPGPHLTQPEPMQIGITRTSVSVDEKTPSKDPVTSLTSHSATVVTCLPVTPVSSASTTLLSVAQPSTPACATESSSDSLSQEIVTQQRDHLFWEDLCPVSVAKDWDLHFDDLLETEEDLATSVDDFSEPNMSSISVQTSPLKPLISVVLNRCVPPYNWVPAPESKLLTEFISCAPHHGAVHGSVYLSAEIILPQNHHISWKKSTTEIAWLTVGGVQNYHSQYKPRCELFKNATLRLDKLTAADTASYELTVTDLDSGVKSIAPIQLKVHNLLSIPNLSISTSSRPVNGSNYSLRCYILNEIVNYTFYKDYKPVDCSQHHLVCSETSQYLYFQPILREDSGNYTCTIRNPVSSNSSDPMLLNVAVRVSAVSLKTNTSSPLVVKKDSVLLKCLSIGTDVSYSWSLDRKALPQNSRYQLIEGNSKLVISPVLRSDSGSFTCTVTNYLNRETSPPLSLSWIPDGHIICSAQHTDNIVELQCSWPGGLPAADLDLMFNNMTYPGKDQVSKNVSWTSIQLGTQMSCSGTHPGPNETCTLIFDTPKSSEHTSERPVIAIEGGKEILTLTLTNSNYGPTLLQLDSSEAPQILPAEFTWYRNNSKLSPIPLGGNFTVVSSYYVSYLIVSSVTKEVVGDYICEAKNIMGSTSFIFTLKLAEKEDSECGCGGLSPGAIAGIVIGSLVFVGLIAVFIFLIFQYKSRPKKDHGFISTVSSPTSPTQAAMIQDEEEVQSEQRDIENR
ncbi:uncharacterized protein WCC33_011612 [Rhinophrynus dorsalis]